MSVVSATAKKKKKYRSRLAVKIWKPTSKSFLFLIHLISAGITAIIEKRRGRGESKCLTQGPRMQYSCAEPWQRLCSASEMTNDSGISMTVKTLELYLFEQSVQMRKEERWTDKRTKELLYDMKSDCRRPLGTISVIALSRRLVHSFSLCPRNQSVSGRHCTLTTAQSEGWVLRDVQDGLFGCEGKDTRACSCHGNGASLLHMDILK